MPAISSITIDPRPPSAPRACAGCGSPWLRPDDLRGMVWLCMLCGAPTVKIDRTPMTVVAARWS